MNICVYTYEQFHVCKYRYSYIYIYIYIYIFMNNFLDKDIDPCLSLPAMGKIVG